MTTVGVALYCFPPGLISFVLFFLRQNLSENLCSVIQFDRMAGQQVM